ncbi:MAG: adenylate/guanylate cyclase domain-containing protein [Deltaproteobacteria bacterium]|nr:adenylate/guanylate cyclase domain-containing protein [Deltaproteobacteria bacterium]
MKKLVHGISVGLLAAVCALLLYASGSLAWLENATWDWRARLFAEPGRAGDRIRLVVIDQTSLDWAKETLKVPLSWPWPRQLYNPVLTALQEGGAKAVAFDLIFTESSFAGVDDDDAFGQAIREKGTVVAALNLSDEQGLETRWNPRARENRIRAAGLADYLAAPVGAQAVKSRASFPVPQVAENAAVLGGVMITRQDADAVIRRAVPFHVFDNRFVPSLGLAAFIAAHPDAPVSITGRTLRLGAYRVPLDKSGNAILRYRGPSQTHKAINAAAVMQAGIQRLEGGIPALDLSVFKDAYVFIGVTAPGFKDLRPTPLQRDYPGVEIHATMLDNLLSDDFMTEAPLYLTILWVIGLSLAAGIGIRMLGKGVHDALAAAVFLSLPFLAGCAFYPSNVWMPVAAPTAAVFLAISASIIVNYAQEGRQKRYIKTAFKQYLSPAVIDRIVENPDKLALGGELRELSIFFSDIQGFTGISEQLGPTKLTALLNDYLTAMTDIILAEGGTIDKYEGDAIIAFWNAPLDVPDHAVRAVRSALQCGRKLADLRPEFRERTGRDIYARIGINTGQVVVGNMGSHQRFDYTFLGDAGNLASRLEGINKQFGTYLMISEYTLAKLGDTFAARELSRVRVVGRNEPLRVYEPMFKEDYAARADVLKTFDEGLQKFYAGSFKDALGIFNALKEKDPAAGAYAAKCLALLDKPPDQWDGVWVMTEK